MTRSQTLSEADGCAILKRVFEARGFSIAEAFAFREGDVSFTADGWDPTARVGYEYMTREEGDHEDLTPRELERLAEWMESGRLFFFIVDETDIADAKELEGAAHAFLDEVERRRAAGRG